MRHKKLYCVLIVFFAVAGFLLELSPRAAAETNRQESLTADTSETRRSSALIKMKEGAQMMIEGKKRLEKKTDVAAAEQQIKDGHRLMMEAERTVLKAQNDTMRRGAKMMMDGLQVLKTKKDSEEAEKMMNRGQEMIIEADKMMGDPVPEKMMQGSRTMMRGLRMRHEKDLKTSDKHMTEGGNMMMDAMQIKANVVK